MKMITGLGSIAVAVALCGYARAQSMADGVKAFSIAINDYCVPAVQMALPVEQVPPSLKAKLVPADSQARRMMQGAPGDKVWAVVPGSDAVFIKQSENGDCNVTALGPPLAQTFDLLVQVLTAGPRAMRQYTVASSPEHVRLKFEKSANRTVVDVDVDGSESGMPDHRSEVSVLVAVVRRGATLPST